VIPQTGNKHKIVEQVRAADEGSISFVLSKEGQLSMKEHAVSHRTGNWFSASTTSPGSQ
jgi:hypothetical protein